LKFGVGSFVISKFTLYFNLYIYNSILPILSKVRTLTSPFLSEPIRRRSSYAMSMSVVSNSSPLAIRKDHDSGTIRCKPEHDTDSDPNPNSYFN
jgi:hypothetical protein